MTVTRLAPARRQVGKLELDGHGAGYVVRLGRTGKRRAVAQDRLGLGA